MPAIDQTSDWLRSRQWSCLRQGLLACRLAEAKLHWCSWIPKGALRTDRPRRSITIVHLLTSMASLFCDAILRWVAFSTPIPFRDSRAAFRSLESERSPTVASLVQWVVWLRWSIARATVVA